MQVGFRENARKILREFELQFMVGEFEHGLSLSNRAYSREILPGVCI